MARKPVVAIVGSGEEGGRSIGLAREMGRLIAEKGWVLVTGGRDAGVMKAANRGAKEVAGSVTVGILPFARSTVCPDVDIPIYADTGQARNNIIVLTADAVIACGVEGPGTASEIALALKNGKQVILLAADRVSAEFFTQLGGSRVALADTPAAALAAAVLAIGAT